MNEQSLLPSDGDALLITNSICCVLCNDLLRPPIMLVDGVGNMCSECLVEKNLRSIHNATFEFVLEKLKLPCKFKPQGCCVTLDYKELRVHQDQCKFRMRLCLLSRVIKCTWEGMVSDFTTHFQEMHQNHIINVDENTFTLQTSFIDLNFIVKLITIRNLIYILQIETDLEKKKLFYQIRNLVNGNSTFYEYTVKHQVRNNLYLKESATVLPIHEIAGNVISFLNATDAVAIDLDLLKHIAADSETITHIFKFRLGKELLNKKILGFIECLVCNNSMRPPINLCQTGHSICSVCRWKLEQCPLCHKEFLMTRNYSLEVLTSGIQYPCLYQSEGCPEVSEIDKITKHESQCGYKRVCCPLCAYSANKQILISHLKHSHANEIVCSELQRNGDKPILIAFNNIFEVTFLEYDCHQFECLVRLIGTNTKSGTFAYELTLESDTVGNWKFIYMDYCSQNCYLKIPSYIGKYFSSKQKFVTIKIKQI